MPKRFSPTTPSDDKKTARAKRGATTTKKPKKDRTVFKVTESATARPKGEAIVPRKLRREQERTVAKSPEGKAVKVRKARTRTVANVAIIAAAVILIAVVYYFYSYKPNAPAMPTENVGPVVATINGYRLHEQNIKVMRGYLASAKATPTEPSAITDKEAFEELKKQIVQYLEAARRHLTSKQTEVDTYVQQDRQRLDAIFASDAQTKTTFDDEIKKMGLTELEYWSSLYPAVARSNAIQKLRSAVLATFQQPNPPLGGTDLANAQKKFYDDFVDGLVKKAKVKIQKDSLK